jgi:flagellar hook-associated protein 2
MPVINFSGIASGIDTSALIKAQSDTFRKTRVEPAKKKVRELEDTNSSLTEFATKLTNIRSKLDGFRTINGGGVAKSASSSNEGIVVASATNAAPPGSYTISSITSIARNHTVTHNTSYPLLSSAMFPSINNGESEANRTMTVNVGNPSQETVSVIFSSTTTLADVVSQINSASDLATASTVNVGTSSSPSYRLMITSNNPGTTQGTISISTGSAIGTLSLTQDPATNAQFTLAGVSGSITRSSNSVTDLFPGINFELQATSASPTTITVGADVSTTISRVTAFVEAYNDLIKLHREQNAVSREDDGQEVENIFGPLATTRTDDGAISSLRDAISAARSGSSGTVRVLADLGISTERDGSLKLDTAVLEKAIQTNPTDTGNLLANFSDTVASVGGTIDLYTRFSGLIDLTKNSNTSQIQNQNSRIAETEAQIQKQEEQLRMRFARLEALMGKLQSQQSTLSSALAGLG